MGRQFRQNKHSLAREDAPRRRSSFRSKCKVLYWSTWLLRSRSLPQAIKKLCVIASPDHMTIDPLAKGLTLTRNFVPGEIKSVVSRVITMRIRWIGTNGDMSDRGHHPVRQHNRIHCRR